MSRQKPRLKPALRQGPALNHEKPVAYGHEIHHIRETHMRSLRRGRLYSAVGLPENRRMLRAAIGIQLTDFRVNGIPKPGFEGREIVEISGSVKAF